MWRHGQWWHLSQVPRVQATHSRIAQNPPGKNLLPNFRIIRRGHIDKQALENVFNHPLLKEPLGVFDPKEFSCWVATSGLELPA
jgi:hypothetical protein